MKKPHISEQIVGYIWLLLLILGVIFAMFLINQTDPAKRYRDERRAYVQYKEDSIRDAHLKRELQKEQWAKEKEERALKKAEREAKWAKQQAEWAAQRAEWDRQKAEREAKRHAFDTISIVLHSFDPNVADSTTFVHLGIPPKVTHNIIRYREKGGHFYSPEDFRRVYGVDTLFENLAPYITFANADSATMLIPYPVKRDTILELNLADTLTLQMIRGIGRYTARQIIWYREKLGGFYTVEQLKEIPNIKHVDSIIPHLTVDSSLVTPLEINYHGVEVLMRHPYLRFEQAKAIRDYRHRKGNIRDWETLRALHVKGKKVFTEEEIERLKPYIKLAD